MVAFISETRVSKKSMLNSFKFLRRFADEAISSQKIRNIVEIGANKCTESLDFSAIYPDADVYAFECNPDTIPICKEAIMGHPRIHLIEKAVSDKDGGCIDFFPIDGEKSKSIHADGNTGASSLFIRNGKSGIPEAELPQKKVRVETVTLDSFIKERGIPGIDLLWLDAQGAELMILKGLKESISKARIIQCEVEFVEEYIGQPLYREIREFLENEGFVFCGFSEEWYPHAADALFIERKAFSRLSFVKRISWRLFAFIPLKPLFWRKVTLKMRRWYAARI